jgi:hypothetical protein
MTRRENPIAVHQGPAATTADGDKPKLLLETGADHRACDEWLLQFADTPDGGVFAFLRQRNSKRQNEYRRDAASEKRGAFALCLH